MNDAARLEALLTCRHPCVAVQTFEEQEVLELIRTLCPPRCWRWSVIDGVRDATLAGAEAVPETAHPAAALYYLTQRIEHPAVCVLRDLAEHLGDARTLRLLRELLQHAQTTGSTLILIDHTGPLPPAIEAFATRLELQLPDLVALEALVRETLREVHRERRIKIDLTRSHYDVLIRNLRGLNARRTRQIIRDVVSEDRRLDEQDIHAAMSRKRLALHGEGLLEFVESPADLRHIGGLHQLKHWLQRRARALTPEAASFGLPSPRGVLLLGVQGAGKSLCAKAIAAAWQRPLLRLDPGVLYDRYVGESERRLRTALHQAEAMAPIVLWIDEIEKAFASAASHSTDGGLSQRMFGSLLTWMQEHRSAVFLVATANDIEALPPELMRKGRFDEIFFVDLPDQETRREIFRIHLQKRGHEPQGFDLERLAECASGHSGAEIEQAVISAMFEAFDTSTLLTTETVLRAVQGSPPLSATMAEKVDDLRRWARGRCLPAN